MVRKTPNYISSGNVTYINAAQLSLPVWYEIIYNVLSFFFIYLACQTFYFDSEICVIVTEYG